MAAAYAAFAVLGAAVLTSADLPRWLGWLGVAAGIGFLAGFVGTPVRRHVQSTVLGAHLPVVLGVVLLVF